MNRNTLCALPLLVCLLGLQLPAQAADSNTRPAMPSASGGDRAERMERARAELAQRFKKADQNGDGLISKDEAKAGLPRIYSHFDEIDTAHRGTISAQDIAAWMQAQRGTRGARRGAQP